MLSIQSAAQKSCTLRGKPIEGIFAAATQSRGVTTNMECDGEYVVPNLASRLLAALFFLPGACVAIASFYVLQPTNRFEFGLEAIFLFLAILCASGIAGCLLRWKITGVLAASVLALYWVPVGAVCFCIVLNPNFLIFVFLYCGVLTIPAFLILGLCTAYARRGLKLAWWRGSMVAGFSCGFVIVAVLSASALKSAAEERAPRTRPSEPIVLGKDMLN